MCNVICMTVYNRPQYLRRVLEGLRQCWGIENYHILISREPGSVEVARLCEAIDFAAHVWIDTNCKVLGIRRNTFKALQMGFKYANFVIYLEDDCVPAPDCLAYFEHCRDAYCDDQRIFTITGYNGPHLKGSGGECAYRAQLQDYDPSMFYRLARIPWFTPSGWATWADRWEEMKRSWQMDDSGIGWGPHLNRIVRGDRYQIFPALARVQNIGEVGTNIRPETKFDEQWFGEHVFNVTWAGALNLPPGHYYELDVERIS